MSNVSSCGCGCGCGEATNKDIPALLTMIALQDVQIERLKRCLEMDREFYKGEGYSPKNVRIRRSVM